MPTGTLRASISRFVWAALPIRCVSESPMGEQASWASRANDGMDAGLIGMREQVEDLGGQFRVNSRPGQGTTVIADLALQVAEELDG